jgi:hypothetical protein
LNLGFVHQGAAIFVQGQHASLEAIKLIVEDNAATVVREREKERERRGRARV